ncbi:MAG: urea ABC transporter permease subunit UrtB [Anaerolinea sp.]|nr:urea ABC transporter permease subunit UrtB [Anaerolinea sp.]MCC6973451.1 urea ABC transporter permease subunit UrtB [Anaerolineae bacterium]CAG1012470.1 High-affinity branched-chain amino acid transport system permease protein LivH [Anaerolineae bacterium]
MESLALQIFNGLSTGSILLLAALGLAFSFGLMKVINMAHGEFIMIGAYVTYFFQAFLAVPLRGAQGPKEGLVFLLSIGAAFLITGLVGFLLEMTLIRRLYGRPLDTLLATWGVGLILQQLARSYDSRNLPVTSPKWLVGAWMATPDLALPYKRLFIIALAVICVVLIYLFLYRTRNGRRIRAAMQGREMASCLGVATRRVDALTFALGAGLAGVAGSALTLIGQIGPQLGTTYIVDAFMVVVLGGVGSLPGTILASVLIGVFNSFLEMSTTATLGKVLVFVLIIAFLQWKPQGLVALRTRS